MGHQGQEPWRERKTYGFSTIDKEFSGISVYTESWVPFPRIFNLVNIYTYTMPYSWHTYLLLIMSKLLWQLTLSRLIHIYIKNTSQRAENCLMETECWVSIAWGSLAIMLHEIRHSLFQLLKIRSHEKWQRRRKKNPDLSHFVIFKLWNQKLHDVKKQLMLTVEFGGLPCSSVEL